MRTSTLKARLARLEARQATIGGRPVSECLEVAETLYEALEGDLDPIVAYVDLCHTDWTLARIGEGRYAATIGARRMVIAATPALALCGAAVRREARAGC